MWKSLFLPWSPQINRWPQRRAEESSLALLLGWALQGWFPTWLSDSLSLSLRIFCSSPWHQPAAEGISTEDRMSLSNSKSWGWGRYHLLEIKGKWKFPFFFPELFHLWRCPPGSKMLKIYSEGMQWLPVSRPCPQLLAPAATLSHIRDVPRASLKDRCLASHPLLLQQGLW